MKKDFFDYLFTKMQENKDIYTIFIDLGFPRVDEFIKAYPDRAINTGASEQTALDIAVGLALENKIPFVYTITPFLFRGFETIRTYINYENLNVKMVGAGRDDEYSKDHGFSHFAGDVPNILATLTNINKYYPEDTSQLKQMVDEMIINSKPSFLSLKR